MSKILVTGGAGYIGSVLVPELLKENHKVIVIDNLMYMQSTLAECVHNKNFSFVKGDVRNRSLVKEHLNESDVVIPLAAIVGAPACDKDPWLATETNLNSVLDLFKMLSKDQRVIMPTTNSAYGKGDKDNHCDENSELKPLSLYAKDKVLLEEALMNHPRATSFRLATVFGISPRMRFDLLVNNFVYKAFKDKYLIVFEGKFKRNFIHVRDVSLAFQLALNNNKFEGEIFNVGLSDANISKLELCSEIKKQIPELEFTESPLGKDPDQRDYIVSNKKIESLGFKPKVSLMEGIKEIISGIPLFDHPRNSNV